MKKQENIIFTYNEMIIICTINGEFIGKATCHPNDIKFFSKRTGENIAYYRAKIKQLKKEKRDIQLQLQSINHLYHTIKNSKYYNSKGYIENRILNHIKYYNNDILEINEEISQLTLYLQNYLKQMDELFTKINKIHSK